METKHVLSLIAAIVSFYFAYSSLDSGDSNPLLVQYADDLEEVHDAIDDSFEYYQKKYNSLCKEKRNNSLKSEFLTLNANIQSCMIRSIRNNEDLSFDEQEEAMDYANSKLKEYPILLELRKTGTIPCW
jgi:hypothetical protein